MPNNPKAADNLKPFKKGADPRRNRKGRPKDISGFREMALSILHERAKDKNGDPLEIDGHDITLIEAVYRKWITSNNPRLQMAAIEYVYGKVPTAVEVSGKDGGALLIHMTWGENGDGNSNDD
jgi:hypothetical protein